MTSSNSIEAGLKERAMTGARLLLDSMDKRVIGQAALKRRLLTALITGGHVLLEGVPGLAKTLSIRSLAELVSGSYQRIQFTPDLLPSDLIGTEVYRPHEGRFEVRLGPVFANFVLADEINRAPAKVQSALLEIMQEHQVTIGRETHRVPEPFLVLATQNPIEQEGTYPLPEAQLDRFLMKVKIDYPSQAEEVEILNLAGVNDPSHTYERAPVVDLSTVTDLQQAARSIYVDPKIQEYIVQIVGATRFPERFGLPDLRPLILLGASPRSSIGLSVAGRAEALLSGEEFVSPQHVKTIAHDVLRHRIIVSYEAEAENVSADEIVSRILAKINIP